MSLLVELDLRAATLVYNQGGGGYISWVDGVHAGFTIAAGVDIENDNEMLDWVKKNAETTYHPVGTCKMGSDPMAVVDTDLRVHGLRGLRVIDASIMPKIVSGNTASPTVMIAEKAADAILAGR